MAVILSSSCEAQLRSEMYKRIKEELDCIRNGSSPAERVVLIVPAQETLQSEEEGFRSLGGEGFFDFVVMSGAKLRSEILKETGSPAKTAVNSIGRKMLLRRISSKRKDELTSFKGVCSGDGFLDLAGDFIVQLKQNDIDPAKLAAVTEELEPSGILASKLSDMQIIYSDYEEIMAGKYTDSEDLLAYTTEKIKDSEYVKSSVFWYFDFYSFTKREYAFLKELGRYSVSLNAAVLAGKNRFACGEKTADRLSAVLSAERTVLEPPAEELRGIKIVECASPYTQSRTIAADILSNVRDRGMSYKDMIVLTQDMGGMGENLKRVLTSSGIPVFMDEKRSMQHSPAARIISSVLGIAAGGFRRQAVLSYLKCGISGFTEDETEIFENYVKHYKIYDKGFLKPFKYGKDQLGEEDFSLVEEIRGKVAQLFYPFAENLEKAETVYEKSKVLYEFLAGDIGMPEKLREEAGRLEEQGYLDAAGEMTQSFAAVTGLLDQMVELFGDEKMSSEEYSQQLLGCFDDIKIGVLPQAEGKLRIGTVTRSAFSGVKVLYIAGFNDGIIPSDPSGDNILTESEIETLKGAGHVFAKDSDTLQEEEMFQIERTLNSDTVQTIICYCQSDLDGNSLRPSALLSQLPVGNVAFSEGQDIDKAIESDFMYAGYIQNKDLVYSKMPQMLKSMANGKEVPEDWKEAYNEVKGSDMARAAAGAVFFRPDSAPLDRTLSGELFVKATGDYYSPTQLEQYSACPFRHFVNNGLRPKELKDFDVGSREAGTIYHTALLELSEKLSGPCRDKGIDMTDPLSPWMTVTEEETKALVHEILEKGKADLLGGVMESDEASEYRTERILKVCLIFAKYMIEQVRKGRVSDMYFEKKFGGGSRDAFPPVYVDTPFGRAVIEGQIDRVDILSSDSGKYVKIIDYKSGNKSFDRKKVEEGLDLQLMIYLEGALGSDEELKPAGVFYYAVKDPEQERQYADVIADEISADAAERLAKDFLLDGITVDKKDVLCAIDSELEGKDKVESTVFDPKLRSASKRIITEDDMESLRQTFKEKLTEICSGIRDGKIAVKPAFFNKEYVACKYCEFKSVCLFSLKNG